MRVGDDGCKERKVVQVSDLEADNRNEASAWFLGQNAHSVISAFGDTALWFAQKKRRNRRPPISLCPSQILIVRKVIVVINSTSVQKPSRPPIGRTGSSSSGAQHSHGGILHSQPP